jgi:outer membrane biosynthesis protein TonB
MNKSLAISAAGHALVLALGLVSFASTREINPQEALPVDVVSASEFNRITKGVETAKPTEKPKPRVEKIAEPKPVEETVGKVSEKKEVAPTAEKPPTPEPPKPVEKKPEPPKEVAKAEPKPAEQKPEPKAEPKPAEKPKPVEKQKPQPDQIAEALKKEEAKKPPKPVEKKPEPPRFDPSKVAALLDKREAVRHASAGDTLNPNQSLGLATGRAAELSQDEMGILIAQYQRCWAPPVGVAEARDLRVEVRVMLNQDGTLSADPSVMNRLGHPLFGTAAESALRAVRKCQPLRTPPIAKYERWKDIIVTFDPREMFRG